MSAIGLVCASLACGGGTDPGGAAPASDATAVSGESEAGASGTAPAPARPLRASAVPTVGDRGQDPEPPGVQELAERVLDAEWNRDKTSRLRPWTVRLRMRMLRLVDRRTGVEGFRRSLTAPAVPVEDRLAALEAEVTEREITIRLPGSVLFDFDSAAIRPDAERTLTEVTEVVAAYAERPVRVEGHTDAVASDDYNQALSERRAASVVDWLVAHGVGGERLTAAGFGESQPAADNATADGRQQNRRVEIVIGAAGGSEGDG